uniref:Peptidase S1 domain-containing protein n=1 Tax=Anopheles melas TaxID=34690 RepID=A0A182U435_9DIPT
MARPKVADRPCQPGSSSDEDVRPHDHERTRHIGGRCHSSSSSFVAVVGILTSSSDRSSVFTSPKYVPRGELGYRYRADRERQQVIDFTRSGINIHPQFTGGSLNNIATIGLEHPVTLNRYVHPIRLPRLSDTRTFEKMEGTSLGLEYNGTMRYLRNQIMSNDDCRMNTQFICTNAYIGGAFCNRMYGAGLVVEDESGPILIGLTNLIYSCSVNNSILYMRLSLLRDWIANSSNYVFDF